MSNVHFLGEGEGSRNMANKGRLTEFDDLPYENLANAIILQATKDYRDAKRKHDQQEISFITKFFRSQWFTQLTKVDPEYILERL